MKLVLSWFDSKHGANFGLFIYHLFYGVYMYIIYHSSRYGGNTCQYAMNIAEINNNLRRLDFEEITHIDLVEIDRGESYFVEDQESNWITIHKLYTRGVFMAIYRDDNFNEEGITVDDRHEIFSGIMLGSMDFEATEIQEVLGNYGIEHIQAVDIEEEPAPFAARLQNLSDMNAEYWQKVGENK